MKSPLGPAVRHVIANDRASRAIYVLSVTAGTALLLQVWLLLSLWQATYHPLPWHDEWDVVTSMAQLHHEGLRLATWYAQHNEHRPVLPRLVFALDFWVFRGQQAFTYSVIAVLAAGLCAVFVRVVQQSRGPGALRPLVAISAAAILLCGQQASNFLWAFQVTWFLVHALAVGSMALLVKIAMVDGVSRPSQTASVALWALAMMCAVGANYSAASGNLVWGSLAVLLLMSRRSMPRWVTIGTMLVGASSVLTYSWGFHLSSVGSGSVSAIVSDPFLGPQFLALALGGPFAPLGHHTAMAAGLVFLAYCGLLAVRLLKVRGTAQTVTHAFGVSVVAFVVMGAVATTLGRAGLGLEGALESRLASAAALGWAALLLLLADGSGTATATNDTLPWTPPRVALVVTAALMLSATGLAGALYPAYDYTPLRHFKTAAASALVARAVDRVALERVGYRSTPVNTAQLEFLAAREWSIFADSAVRDMYLGRTPVGADTNARCEVVADSVESLELGTTLKVSGVAWLQGRGSSLAFSDESGTLVGAALTAGEAPLPGGPERPSLGATVWTGYMTGSGRALHAFASVGRGWTRCRLTRASDSAASLFVDAVSAAPLSAAAWRAPWLLYEPGLPAFVRTVTGLSVPESFGRWTVGPEVRIEFAEAVPATFVLELVMGGFGPNVGQSLTATIGGQSYTVRIETDLLQMRAYAIPLANPTGSRTLVLSVPAPTRPSVLGLNTTDDRMLGVAIQSLRVQSD